MLPPAPQPQENAPRYWQVLFHPDKWQVGPVFDKKEHAEYWVGFLKPWWPDIILREYGPSALPTPLRQPRCWC